jgi:hypothetical protein
VSKLSWDNTGERLYETGVDRGVLYIPDSGGDYTIGYAWSGLVSVTESPSGAESNPQYADNIKYLNLLSVEEFGATIEAFTYPGAFGQCDGTAEPEAGVLLAQQNRKTFGLCYRTKLGNDVAGNDFGYKLHLVYGCLAAPSEKAYNTVNDSPEAITFSWDVSTTPHAVTGFKPTALIVIDSTKVTSDALLTLENFLYGTVGSDPSLPLPDAVLAIFAGTLTQVTPTAPTYVLGTHTITIPTVTGVTYKRNGIVVTGDIVIAVNTVITAQPNTGYKFPAVVDDDWFFSFA